MLYLDEVAIHNFKSFRNATIKFNKGFNCIVGPNGSGKSNICDSLLFALGENHLRRMRVNQSIQLINNFVKADREEGHKRGTVRVKFSGDKQIEIVRSIRSDRKVSYRMDGKRVTRQEVLEVLRSYNSDINETNTMTQGEITYLLNLNPKQRRELIDIAAGIREFNEKRDAATRELEKVDQRINETKILISERSGYLNELEKEKKDAERHIELTNTIKINNYTILKGREKEIQEKFEDSIKSFNEKNTAKEKIEKEIAEIDSTLSSLNAERDRIVKSMSAKNAEVGLTNKILEETNKGIAVSATQVTAAEDSLKTGKSHLEELQTEHKKISAKEKENYDSLKKLMFELEVKSKNLPQIEGEEGADSGNLTERYNENFRKLEQSETKLVAVSSEHMQLYTEHQNTEREVLELHKALNEYGAKRTSLTNKIKSSKDALSTLDRNKKEVEHELEKETKKYSELRVDFDKLQVETINLREQRARFGADTDRSMDTLMKNIGEGFHGRAMDLCSFDDKYALAVQAAVGARMNYFVVDSIATANDAIKVLKEKKLGRASFIPLKEISAAKSTKAEGTPLIEHVTFDKKFAKAFEYIFSGTFLVDSIRSAEKGVGGARFVTLDGDLVETSGVVTGGAMKAALTAAAVDAKLKKTEKERKDLEQKIAETEVALNMLRKKIANYETEIINYDLELKHSLDAEDDVHRGMDSLEGKVKQYESKNRDVKDKLEKAKVDKERTETIIKQLKDENTKLRESLDAIVASKSKHGKSKEESAKLKKLMEEVEKLKIDIASFNTENGMLKTRREELDAEIKKEQKNIDVLKTKKSQLEKEIESLTTQKTELSASLETHGKKASGMFKEIQALEEKISKAGFEKGKASADREKTERDLIQLEGAKSQLQTRLSDIKAELAGYQKMEISKGKIEDLERELIIAKNELEKLGPVNLKAPEMYESKKKDLDDVQNKMSTLDGEKSSISEMIEQIEAKKLGIFMETLGTVNENFKKLFSYIFDDESSLHLQDPKDPFNSGLTVDVKISGKKHNADLLSGGQKSLIMLMLIFAIQMRRPMSFYVFDEIDIALDKENSKKLSKLIKELSEKSQFIVVSHNDSLIAAADTAIGVVSKANESQVVGIQLTAK